MGRGVSYFPCFSPTSPFLSITLSAVLKLLSNRHFSPPAEAHELSPPLEDAHVSDGSSSSPSASERLIPDREHGQITTARALVHIDVLAANAHWSPSDDAGIVMGNPLMTPPHSPEAQTFSQTSQVNIFHSPKPRPLRAIDPVVTFTSPSFVMAKSSCSVYFDGNCVHTDVAEVNCTSTKDDSGMFLYRTTLIPQYWDRLCQSHGMFSTLGWSASIGVDVESRARTLFHRSGDYPDNPGTLF